MFKLVFFYLETYLAVCSWFVVEMGCAYFDHPLVVVEVVVVHQVPPRGEEGGCLRHPGPWVQVHARDEQVLLHTRMENGYCSTPVVTVCVSECVWN